MTSLVINKTDATPQVVFKENGKLLLIGRSMPEDVALFYNPLFDWLEKVDVEHVEFEIRIEYMNTASSKKVLDLLRTVEENKKVKSIEINWFYEEDDLDMIELGEIYEDQLTRSEFHYYDCVDIEI